MTATSDEISAMLEEAAGWSGVGDWPADAFEDEEELRSAASFLAGAVSVRLQSRADRPSLDDLRERAKAFLLRPRSPQVHHSLIHVSRLDQPTLEVPAAGTIRIVLQDHRDGQTVVIVLDDQLQPVFYPITMHDTVHTILAPHLPAIAEILDHGSEST